jgi:hypothetical protein
MHRQQAVGMTLYNVTEKVKMTVFGIKPDIEPPINYGIQIGQIVGSSVGDLHNHPITDNSTKTTTTQSQKSLWRKIVDTILDIKKWFTSFLIAIVIFLIKELLS